MPTSYPHTKVFLATTGAGLARAAPQADESWDVRHLLRGEDVRCLAADPFRPQTVYAGTQGNGILRSEDGGLTWSAAGLSGKLVKSIAVSPIEPGVIYAGTKPALVFVSRDQGVSWVELESFRRIPGRWFWISPAELPFQAYVQSLVLSPKDPKVIVAGIEAGAVVRSTDGGQTWTGHRPGAVRDCHSLFFHPSDGNWVYEGGGTGAAFSQDGGNTWCQPREGLDRRYCWAAAADPTRPEVWYVSASPGPGKAHSVDNAQAFIFRSTGGSAWQKLGGGLPQPLDHMPYALLVDQAEAGHLVAGLSNGDVWLSPDGGDTWEQMPFNLGGIHSTLIMV